MSWRRIFLGIIAAGVFSSHAQGKTTHGFSTSYNDSLSVHYGVFTPDAPVVADVLYLHGYGDTFDNHPRLFQEWNAAGMRVIAFDLPSHGKTRGGTWDDLDWFSFSDLANLAGVIERETLEDSSRPLFLTGWSTGGLLATRMVQSVSLMTLSRFPSGLILFAPGVSVKKCVGNSLCQITNETLTHHTNLTKRLITPPTPLLRVNFAAKLLYNAARAWDSLPTDLHTLVWVASDHQDYYVNSPQLKKWVYQQQKSGAAVHAFQCPEAYHELDNELEVFGGKQVREGSAQFLRSIVEQTSAGMVQGPCQRL